MVRIFPWHRRLLIAWFTSKQRGVSVDKVFAEIPPE